MERFKDRFSVDYVQGERTPNQPSSEAMPGIDDALITYGRPVLDALQNGPNQTGRVFELADKVGVRVDVLFPVVEFLERKSYITRVTRDRLGNDVIRLTQQGLALLAPSR